MEQQSPIQSTSVILYLQDIVAVVEFDNGTVLNVDFATQTEGDKIPTIRINHGNDISDQIPPSLIQSVYHWLLHQCPYGLSRLAKETGPLEYVTGLEFIGMCACAKQWGNMTHFKILWSWERVIVENQEELISVDGIKTCTKDAKSKNDATTVFRGETSEITSDDVTPPSSPRTDPSPSPIPQTNKCRTVKFQFYRLIFAGRKLPILVVNCYSPTLTDKKICCYGGWDANGERCFLSCWEYSLF